MPTLEDILGHDFSPPPEHLTQEPAAGELAPHRPLATLPEVTPHLDDVNSNTHAKQTDELGKAIRSALGIGALALMPDLIEDLRRAKDPDSRLKFIAMALKEGGYGVKEDKGANLPVFHFNFSGPGDVTVTAAPAPEPTDVLDVSFVERADPPAIAAPAPPETPADEPPLPDPSDFTDFLKDIADL